MRAVICKELGPLENLSLEEVPTPPLLNGNVRLRVLASGVNYVDGLLIQGKYQIKPPTPFIPGMEVVGEVIWKRTRDSRLQGKTLVLRMDSGPLKQELSYQKTKLLDAINEMMGGESLEKIEVW
jgi:threonine dehydrogenase-like Zn-dependent dehydrogenase